MKVIAKYRGNGRVWHIPQAPVEPYYVYVDFIEEAILIITSLKLYDNYLRSCKLIPEYISVTGFEMFEGGEWIEWRDPNTGCDIEEFMEEWM